MLKTPYNTYKVFLVMIILYFGIVELIIQFLMREIIFKKFINFLNISIIKELFECRKCVGFWVAVITAHVMNVKFVEINYFVDYLITAIFTTYVLYYVSIGITTVHQTVVVGRLDG